MESDYELVYTKPFMGLLMGRSSDYYIDIIQTIDELSGKLPFKWTNIIEKIPNKLNRSLMVRLKSSNWIIKSDYKIKKSSGQLWTLHPDAMNLIKTNLKNKKIRDEKKQIRSPN